MRAPRSLQGRLALAVGLAVTVLWIAAAGATLRELSHEMDEVFDGALRDAAHRLLPLAVRVHEGRDRGLALGPLVRGERDGHRRKDDDDDDWHEDRRNRHAEEWSERIRQFNGDVEDLSYVVRDGDGSILLISEDAEPDDFPPFRREGFSRTATHRLFYESARGEDVTIAVAEPLSRRRDIAREIATNLALPLAVVIPLSLLAIVIAVGTSLRPVRSLRQQLAERGSRNLSALGDGGLPTELRPIVGSINDLLSRLRAAFEAERSFAANAAHELRTPVAGAIAQAQRLRAETADRSAAARAAEIETTLKRLNRLSEKLMQLARAEGARLRVAEPSDLRPVLRIVADDLERLGSAGRIALTMPETPVLSDLDPDAFGILCRNLIENALKHGTPQGPVEVALGPGGVLSVANDGAPVPPEELARLTARFARSNGRAEGAGLGLAIVRTIADRAAGRIELLSPRPGKSDGFEARFTLPARP
ncbi:two-component sensor histidine kinase [Rhodovulum sp. BSW8]|uniref:histidine kinase n=1 Tax=Rhodovulum visakhapatnamense TaxID=364297 RepID=A0A4R8G4K0_9RHOB|nr:MULTISPECIES: ATP-binding protein [Rhodovulum]RBO52429.1 two-component sensor histidine kinase [Rhodovulum sp. BSW8]TDX33221.1 two-component system OmpR family sensor kinase [Rhodovulum visakhapatnamense]